MKKFCLAFVAMLLVLSMPMYTIAESADAVSSASVETEEEVDAVSSASVETEEEVDAVSSASVETEEEVDAVSSASLTDYYGDAALTGEDLMNAINAYSGFYTITSTDADGNANTAFFIYGMVENNGEYYLQFGLAENQTRSNLLATGKAIAVYAAAPSDQPFAYSGARMWCEMVTDEALYSELNTTGSDTALFFHVTEIRPLG